MFELEAEAVVEHTTVNEVEDEMGVKVEVEEAEIVIETANTGMYSSDKAAQAVEAVEIGTRDIPEKMALEHLHISED